MTSLRAAAIALSAAGLLGTLSPALAGAGAAALLLGLALGAAYLLLRWERRRAAAGVVLAGLIAAGVLVERWARDQDRMTRARIERARDSAR